MTLPPAKVLLAFIFGAVLAVAILALAVLIPSPTPFQYWVFRVLLAVAVGGVVGLLPGFIEFKIPTTLRATGALGFAALVYYSNPAQLIVETAVGPDAISMTIPSGQTVEQVAQSIAAADQMTIDWATCPQDAKLAIVTQGPIRAADGRRLLEALRNRVQVKKRINSVIRYDDRGVYEIHCD